MLEGLLVDLVPYGERFHKLEHEWHNNEGVFFWSMGDRWIETQAQIDAGQRERAEEAERGSKDVIFGVQTKDGTPIGLFGAPWIVPHNRLAMLTALIGEPDYWGGGYGTDALLLLVDYLFDWLDLRKLWLMTMDLNVRVKRQMEKVGFTLETRQRDVAYANGQHIDALTYSLLRGDWPGRAAMIKKLDLRARKDL
ncbi:MAG: GNAT family N-acetyltransferase [Anaerolineae bacterium]|nr:GNAT family N-acetyltransferase [Anaerolineae bacterium]